MFSFHVAFSFMHMVHLIFEKQPKLHTHRWNLLANTPNLPAPSEMEVKLALMFTSILMA